MVKLEFSASKSSSKLSNLDLTLEVPYFTFSALMVSKVITVVPELDEVSPEEPPVLLDKFSIADWRVLNSVIFEFIELISLVFLSTSARKSSSSIFKLLISLLVFVSKVDKSSSIESIEVWSLLVLVVNLVVRFSIDSSL